MIQCNSSEDADRLSRKLRFSQDARQVPESPKRGICRGQRAAESVGVISHPISTRDLFCVGDTYILGGAAGLGHGSRNGRAGAQLGSKTRARLTQGPRAVDLLPKATRSCQSGRLGIETM